MLSSDGEGGPATEAPRCRIARRSHTHTALGKRPLTDFPFKHKAIINPNHTRKRFIEK